MAYSKAAYKREVWATAEMPRTRRSGKVPRAKLSVTDAVAALLITMSLVMVLWHLQKSSIHNANTGSRYATVESIVDYGTYAIDKSVFRNTIDRVEIDGHSYSSKPPLLPTYSAAVYWVQQKLTGKTARDNEGDVVWMGSLFSGWLFHLVFLIFFYRLVMLLCSKQLAIIGGVACAGFAYLGVGYATTLNNHSIAAAVATAGFYYAVRARTVADESPTCWVLSGIWLGFLPGLDLLSTVITGVIGLYLFATDRRRALIYFAPALLPGLGAHLALTYATTGSFIPIYLRRELYDYTGSYWKHPVGIDALHEPKHIYAFNVLLGHHGLFSMTPIFSFAVYELWRALRSKSALHAEALVATSVTVALSTLVILFSHNYGGYCVGMRWFIPFMPFLLLFVAVWLDRVELGPAGLGLFLAAFAVSQLNVQDALTSPWQYSVWQKFLH